MLLSRERTVRFCCSGIAEVRRSSSAQPIPTTKTTQEECVLGTFGASQTIGAVRWVLRRRCAAWQIFLANRRPPPLDKSCESKVPIPANAFYMSPAWQMTRCVANTDFLHRRRSDHRNCGQRFHQTFCTNGTKQWIRKQIWQGTVGKGGTSRTATAGPDQVFAD